MSAARDVAERFPGTDRFEVRKAVGSGGFGTVYQVWDREHQQLVALKHLNRSDPQTLRRFKQEFRSLANVSHLHLVSLYELHQRESDWFFTMEFVDGPTFSDHLRPEPAVAWLARASSLKLTRPARPASQARAASRRLERIAQLDDRETLDPRSSERPAPIAGAPLAAMAVAPTSQGDRVALGIGAPGLAPTTPFVGLVEGVPFATPFYGIEAPDAATLARWEATRPALAVGSPPDADVVRALFRQLVEALAWLHASGHLHRDVKPSNVLVAPGDVVKVLDFGLVTRLLVDDLDNAHALVGTPAYMAPELCAGLGASPASDWYSVGVMLYLVMTGQLPFGGDISELVLAKQALDARPPRELGEVPKDLEDLCLALLARNPVERPDAAALLDGLGHRPRSRARATPTTVAAPARFVGRDAEVARLSAVLRTPRAALDIALVEGLSGLGKSTLVEHALRAVEDEGAALVLRSRCFERGSVRYRALDGAIDDLARALASGSPEELAAILPADPFDRAALARLFPALPGIDPEDALVAAAEPAEVKRRAFAALRAVFYAVAARRAGGSENPGLVIAIDDAQWADEDSLTPLAELMRDAPGAPIRWVLSYRSDDVGTSPFLGTFFEAIVPLHVARIERITIGPLSPDEALALATASGGADARAIVAEAEGNPLLISELARVPAVPAADGTSVRSEARSGGAMLAELLVARVGDLPGPARAALELIAIAGEPVPTRLVRAATGVEQRELNRLVLEHLVAARSHAAGEVVMTWHDRVRETVSGRLSGATRAQRHRELAATAEAQGGADALFLHTHYREGGEPARAHPHGLAAAEAASRAFAFDRASEIYRQLIADAGPGVELRPLHEALGGALRDAGRGTSAAKAYLDAAELARDAVEVRRLEILAAEQYLFAGAFREGEEVIRKVLARVGLSVARGAAGALASFAVESVRTRLRGQRWTRREESAVPVEQRASIDTLWSVTIGLSMAQPLASQAFQQRHIRAALDAGEPGRIARALAVSLAFSALPGGHDERKSDALYARSHAITDTLSHPYYRAFETMGAGGNHWLRGRWPEARREVEAALAVFDRDCTGVTWEKDTARFVQLSALAHESDFARLLPVYRAFLADAIERGDLYMETQLRTRFGPLVDLLDDAPERARLGLQKALSRWQAAGFQVVNYWGYLNRVNALVYEGEGRAAWRELVAGQKAVKRSLLLMGQYYRVQYHALIARAGLSAMAELDPKHGDHRAIARRVDASIARLAKEDMGWTVPKARLFEGLRHSGATAVTALDAAREGFVRASMHGHAIAAEACAARTRGDASGQAAAWSRWGARAPERFLRIYTGI